ncbi:MAG: hypothetical protein KME43_26520 [Myxacorys chilensis ATA2-1-KO14]|nr:hypothetical protein [Myxacorys chilensis ATA2-1-KO14]
MMLGRYLSLEDFCTCTKTYRKFVDSFATRGRARINPYPQNTEETIPALQALCQHLLDPIIDHFGKERFQLTYGFCSKDLKRFLSQKDPETGIKNGRVDPSRDQHMAHEVNRNGRYYCDRLGAACDFRIVDLESDRLVEWILEQRLPFDSLYFYGSDRPIHISYGMQHKQEVWAFTPEGTPTKKGMTNLIKLLDQYN